MVYDQAWPHQDDPQDLSTRSNSKMNQWFNEDVKSLMTFNTLDTLYKVIVRNQETDTKYHTIYRINKVGA